MKQIELKPIKESSADFDELEERIRLLFLHEIYLPLVKILKASRKTLQNAQDDLLEAVKSGRLVFDRGKFTGRLNATLTKELRKIGAEWDRKQGCFSVPQSKLPPEIRQAIQVSEYKFQQSIGKLDAALRQISPEEVAKKLKAENIFDRLIWKTEKRFEKSVANITVAPKLSRDQVKRVASEYTDNIQLFITDFTEKETTELRERIIQHSLSGFRREAIVKEIQESYGVSVRKAKFLARQETSLLITKHKQVRYQSAGVNSYKWACVAGSPAHPVRKWHKDLEGRVFTWDNPPITTEPGKTVRRNNPGQDYNCRCFAIPIVKF